MCKRLNRIFSVLSGSSYVWSRLSPLQNISSNLNFELTKNFLGNSSGRMSGFFLDRVIRGSYNLIRHPYGDAFMNSLLPVLCLSSPHIHSPLIRAGRVGFSLFLLTCLLLFDYLYLGNCRFSHDQF